MDFKVTARRYGDSVKFVVNAEDTKAALRAAKVEAGKVFDYEGGEGSPTVSVAPIEEKE